MGSAIMLYYGIKIKKKVIIIMMRMTMMIIMLYLLVFVWVGNCTDKRVFQVIDCFRKDVCFCLLNIIAGIKPVARGDNGTLISHYLEI